MQLQIQIAQRAIHNFVAYTEKYIDHCSGAGVRFRCRLICHKVPEIMLLCIKLLIPLFGGYGHDLMQAQCFDVAIGALCARK